MAAANIFPQQLFPLLNTFIAEAVIVLALARGSCDLEPGELLAASFRGHTSSYSSAIKTPPGTNPTQYAGVISGILTYAIDNFCPFCVPYATPECLFRFPILVVVKVSKIVPDHLVPGGYL